jgi:hypothetical protein
MAAMSRVWLGIGLVLSAACRAQPSAADPRSCGPTSATLPGDASADELAGAYRLQLVATTGDKAGTTISGSLRLTPYEAAQRHRSLPDGRVDSSSAYVLHGMTDLTLSEIGAEAGDLTSSDPRRPGVLVISTGPKRRGPPRVLLRLGAEANQRDLLRFDGAYTVLRVREISADGFSGEWESGAPLPKAGGHFCAVRATDSGS